MLNYVKLCIRQTREITEKNPTAGLLLNDGFINNLML